MDDLEFYYWDVFPKVIKQTAKWREVRIPLSVRGDPEGELEFETADDDIAWVDNEGTVHCGWQPGSTMIMVYDETSVRYVQVEITEFSEIPM